MLWNIQEQKAFIEAYKQNVSCLHENELENSVTLYASGQDIPYTENYASIMDAIGIWNQAVLFQMKQGQPK